MFTYHSGALVGSAAYPATWSRGRLITISVSTSTAIVSPFGLAASAHVSRHDSSRCSGGQVAGQAIEHCSPTVTMRRRDGVGQSAVDDTQLGRISTFGLEFHRHQAGLCACERRSPCEHQAPRRVDLDVLAKVFDNGPFASHDDSQSPSDTK